ncbi:MAG: isochorismatase family protein [Micrococcaceae bacterium]
MKKALLVVDVQNDFCEGGSLAVEGGAQAATDITSYIEENGDNYDYIIASKDWHIEPGSHFSDNPDFVDSWPPHCVVGTEGSEFHPNLQFRDFDAVFYKGQYDAAYSAFEGVLADTDDSSKYDTDVTLSDWLNKNDIKQLDLVGIASEYCVQASAEDSAKNDLNTTVLIELTAAIYPDKLKEATNKMEAEGIKIK